MPTAIVTGATGITGTAIVKALSEDPQWTKIYALSRSQKGKPHEKIVHGTLDLQSTAAEMAEQLADVSADYVFFCAYLAQDDEGDAAKVNGAMLQNFLDALAQTGAAKQLRRFILTTGLKQYGVHLGQPKNPTHETDAWIEGDDRPPNFYYNQQRILADAAKKSSSSSSSSSTPWEWVVTYPQDVIGFARGNFMNLATSLGLYAAVSHALPGSELPFPGSRANYLAFNCWTSASIHAAFCLWAATAAGAGNEAFNVTNGDTESWQNLWPRVAARFGCTVPRKMFPSNNNNGGYGTYEATTAELAKRPPIDDVAAAMGLQGEFAANTIHMQIDTAKWAQRPEVVQAYQQLKRQHGLEQEAWDKATWAFLSFVLGRDYSCVVSMSKARRLGWTGYQDTWDAFEEAFGELEDEGILPRLTGSEKKKG